jgi:hypothetical protein
MRILICGARDFDEPKAIEALIDALPLDTVIIHGCADGADSMAGAFAKRRGMKVLEFPARWDIHGRAAGPIRNKEMLVDGKPDKVYAFYRNKIASRGTRNMVMQAMKAGVPVWENK